MHKGETQEPYKERCKSVFKDYCESNELNGEDKERDTTWYDMIQRCNLAKMVATDGHKTVADLGSYKGGMTYALKECGIGHVVSTERSKPCCERHIKLSNDDVVCCDVFRLPLRHVDALVSYCFLGAYIPDELKKGVTLAGVFDGLSKSSDTIYSVDFRREYAEWFGYKALEEGEILQKLKETLTDFEIEQLGSFGDCGWWAWKEPRIGFKFTKRTTSIA